MTESRVLGDYQIYYEDGKTIAIFSDNEIIYADSVVNIEDLVKEYSGQHYAICYGDVSDANEDYGNIKGIRTMRV